MISSRGPILKATLMAVTLLASGAGCASDPMLGSDGRIPVERIPSSQCAVTFVHASHQAGVVTVRGQVSHRFPRRGAIPGYLDIALIGPDGAVLTETRARPMRRNRQAQSAYFNTRLEMAPPAGSRVRILHRMGSWGA